MQSLSDKPSIVNVNQIYFYLYYYLYLSSRSKKENVFSFKLPDTILFIDDRPVIWIFTNKERKIKKKYSSRLNSKSIYEYFKSKQIEYGKDCIVAYYVYSSDDNKVIKFEDPRENEYFTNQKKLVEYLNKRCINLDTKNSVDNSNTLVHEFFTAETLLDFLENRKKRQGFLQLFINSQQDPNSTYRLIWSPSHLTSEIRHSRLIKAKQGVHFYEKVVTYESDEYCINTESVKSKIALDKLNGICLEITNAIKSLFNNSINIKTAIFYLKQDLDFNMNFLYCSSIGFIEYEDKEHNVFLYKGKIFKNKLSDNFPFHLHKTIYKKKDQENYKTMNCVSCQKFSNMEMFHVVDYLSIIKCHIFNRSKPSFKQFDAKLDEIFKHLNIITVMHPSNLEQNRLNTELMRIESSNFPFAIRSENPDMTNELYKVLKTNKLFLEKKTQVCEECFFKLIDIKYYTKDDFNAKIFQGNIKKNIVRLIYLYNIID